MRYITDSDGYVKQVSFGADIVCDGQECIEYTGGTPSGYKDLEDWFMAEVEKLYRWKIVDGQLTLDSTAVAPREVNPVFLYLIDETNADYPGYTDGWRWAKYKDGTFKAEHKANISTGTLSKSSVIDGLMYATYEAALPLEAVAVDVPKWAVVRDSGLIWVSNNWVLDTTQVSATIFRAIASTASYDLTIGCTVTGQWLAESSPGEDPGDEPEITYTNMVPQAEAYGSTDPLDGVGYRNDSYISSSGGGAISAATDGYMTTGFIPYEALNGVYPTIYVEGLSWLAESHARIGFCNYAKSLYTGHLIQGTSNNLATYFTMTELDENYWKLEPNSSVIAGISSSSPVSFIQFSLKGDGADLTITLDEPVK